MSTCIGKINEVIFHARNELWVVGGERIGTQEEQDAEDLGIAIANWARWDSVTILRVCIAALTDANFCDLATLIEDELDKLIKE